MGSFEFELVKIRQKELFIEETLYVYQTIGLLYEIRECRSLGVLNKYVKELHNKLIHLNTLFLQHNYSAICEEGINDFTKSTRMRPDASIVNLIQNPRDSDQIRTIILNSINDHFQYWESVLSSYKTHSAYIKRIKYLIQSIEDIHDYGGIYCYSDIRSVLENKRHELSKRV